MHHVLTVGQSVDAGVDQITRDRVCFDAVNVQVTKEGRIYPFYVVWNEHRGIERGMFFPTQGGADNYFVVVTAPACQRARPPARKEPVAGELTHYQKLLQGLPLGDVIAFINNHQEEWPCPTENP